METIEPLLVSTRGACCILGIGNTKLYQLINSGSLDTRKIGRRTLITIASLRDVAAGVTNVTGKES